MIYVYLKKVILLERLMRGNVFFSVSTHRQNRFIGGIRLFPIHDENRSGIRPYVNYGLILANILIFFFFMMQGTYVLEGAIWDLGTIPYAILNGEKLWTLLTSMFMHADIMHLLGNMLYLWVFGDNIEAALGHFKYIIFYLFGGLAASFVHISSIIFALPSLGPYWGVINLKTPAVGASGAISAVLGAYLLLYPRARIRTVVFYIFIQIISVPAYFYLGFWFLYQLMMGMFTLTGMSSGVAFWAHIGGFVTGFLMVKPFGAKVKPMRRVKPKMKPIKPLYVSPLVRTPFVDMVVEEDSVKILAELPGVEAKDINIIVSSWDLLISAQHGEIKYYRRIALPTLVIPKVEDFDYRNGVLSFRLRRMI